MSTTNIGLDRGTLVTHDHPKELAHHFQDMSHQHEAAKLGMWLFLGTELLLFGGLFCVYTVYRANNPELFHWGSQFLNVKLGALNTAVLIFSSVTFAMAVTYIQLGRRWPTIITLAITFLCGLTFMAIKSVEYEHKWHENLVWGTGFYETPDHVTGGGTAVAGAAFGPGDRNNGQRLWNATCRSCHGAAGEGVAGQGRDIRSSEFIQERDTTELIDFIKVGRLATDPLNTMNIQMPPKGGNPLLKDQDLADIDAFIRSWQIPIIGLGEDDAEAGSATEDDAAAPEPAPEPIPEPIGETSDAPTAAADEPAFWIPKSSIPTAPDGPPGLKLGARERLFDFSTADPDHRTVHHTVDPDRPKNAHIFFGIYFVMTGLHGVHVLMGMALILWLMLRTLRGDFARHYFTPVELGSLYWHVVDLIWIFLFPLLYLIG